MRIIESVRNFAKTYPGLSGGELHVDFLPADERQYSIDVIPCDCIVKRYIDGSSVKQFLFVLATRTYYGADTIQQIENLGFFDDFTAWIETCDKSGSYPTLPTGLVARNLSVTTSGYVFSESEDSARYQIQLRLEYFEPAEIEEPEEEEDEI